MSGAGAVFFVDRALGRAFPDALEAAGIAVVRHDDHFGPKTLDVEWIPEVARRGWYGLSKDRNIYRNPVELRAVLASGLGYFILTGGSATHAELASNFIDLRPAVVRFIDRTPRPFVASVTRPSVPGASGRVRLRKTRDDL